MTNNKKYRETYWNKVFLLDSFFLKLLKLNREKMIKIFFKKISYTNSKTILDIGTTPSPEMEHNILLNKTLHNHNITCLSNLDCNSLKKKFPNIKKFIIGDGKKTRLPNKKFNIVYSSATIEHVGSFSNQVKFVKECCRLANQSVFITTPNRTYPIDFHTKLPLIHLFPKKVHRKILKFLGYDFFSQEKNLNLLSVADIKKICKNIGIANYEIIKHKFIFFTSNLILVITRES